MPSAPVSAIIPVRDGAAFIGEALQSIFAQTSAPNEVIVVDDGSQDDTEREVRRFGGVVYCRQEPQGQSAARNRGADMATQPFIAFLDADDVWTPDKTEQQLRLMERRPELSFAGGRMVQFRVGPSGEKMTFGAPTAANLPGLLLMRRDAFRKVGPFATGLRVGEPLEWWARAADLNLLVEALPSIVLMRRVHDDNLGKKAPEPMRDYLRLLHQIVKRRRGEGE